jgi:hypothetical protein
VENEPSVGYFRMTLAVVLGIRDQWAEAMNEAKNALADEHVMGHTQILISGFFLVAAIAGHVPECLAVLSASPAASKLEPLLTALQILNGQTPNAPHEVLEVAKDIVKRIETLRASQAPTITPTKKTLPAKKPKTRSRR